MKKRTSEIGLRDPNQEKIMKKTAVLISSVALAMLTGVSIANAQDAPGYECDNSFGDCGTPNQSGGGGCGCGGGSILVNNTDVGDTYQFADDYDNDGIEDNSDNCLRMDNLDQADTDGDGVGDLCDICRNAPNTDQFDLDGDGIGDACDDDMDGDTIPNSADNCASVPNPFLAGLTVQGDTDGDGQGDACDDDIDGDGVSNLDDPCPMSATITTPTADQRALCFPDQDGDGIADIQDNCATKFNPSQANMNGSPFGDDCDPDIDGDSVMNEVDNCRLTINPEQDDTDRDGLGGACDTHFCYTVFGDNANCLDPEVNLTAYTPSLIGQTGQPVLLRLFANRENQPMRYSWRVVGQPEGADVRLENAEGTVTVSSPYEYRYLVNEAPILYGSIAGEYKVELSVESVWEDRVSKKINESSLFTATVTLTGEKADLPAASDAGGCSVTSDDAAANGGLWLLALGLVGLVFRRRNA